MWYLFYWQLSILTWAWRSYVAVTLWRWFAEPIGGVHLTVVRAMGIGLVVSLAAHRTSSADMEADECLRTKLGVWQYRFVGVATKVLYPLLVLGCGWLYKQVL